MKLYDVFYRGRSYDRAGRLPAPSPDIDYAVCVSDGREVVRPVLKTDADAILAKAAKDHPLTEEDKDRGGLNTLTRSDYTEFAAAFGDRTESLGRVGVDRAVLAWIRAGKPAPTTWYEWA